MKYTIRFSNSFVTLLLLGGLSQGVASAQQPQKTSRADTLRRELTVVSDAEVHLEAIAPMASTYLFDKPKVTRLEAVPPRSTGDFTPSVVLPEHPALSDRASWIPQSGKRAYLDLTGGWEPFVRAQAGYSDVWQKKHLFDAHFAYQGEWGYMFGLDAHSAPFNSPFYRHKVGGQVLYEYLGEGATHTVLARGDYERFNYYGYFYKASTDHDRGIKSPLDARQDYEAISYRYTTAADRDFDAMFNIGFEHTGRRYSRVEGISTQAIDEYRLLGSFRLQNARNEDLSWGLAGNLLGQLNSYNSLFLMRKSEVTAPDSYFSVDLAPQVHLDGWLGEMQWKVSAGAGVGFVPVQLHSFFFFPKVKASLLWEHHLEFFARAEGGLKAPSLHEVAQEVRYLHPDYVVLPEAQILDSGIGVRADLPYGVSLALSGGYALSHYATYWEPVLFSEGGHSPYFAAFRPALADGAYWFVSGRLGYALGTKLQASLQWTERRYNLKEGAIAQGKPTRLVDLALTYHATDRLNFALEGLFRLNIPFTAPHDQTETMLRSHRRVRLTSAWHLADWLSVHGELSAPFFLSTEYPLAYQDSRLVIAAVGATVLF